MKKLYILRHAKADHNSKIDDHERPLNTEGLEACSTVARYMQAQHIMPELVLCSPSTRTRGTLETIAEHMPLQATIRFLPSLYLATAGELFSIINAVDDSVSSLLLCGHNPGLHHFSELLAGGKGNKQLLDTLKTGLPTASLVSFECPTDSWQDMEPGLGTLTGLFNRKLAA